MEKEMKSKIATLQKIDVKIPSRYRVIFQNDNVTPMEYVVFVLKTFFNYDEDSAASKMLQVHNHGSAVIGVYSYSEAETRKELTDKLSKKYNYPLQVLIEEEK